MQPGVGKGVTLVEGEEKQGVTCNQRATSHVEREEDKMLGAEKLANSTWCGAFDAFAASQIVADGCREGMCLSVGGGVG